MQEVAGTEWNFLVETEKERERDVKKSKRRKSRTPTLEFLFALKPPTVYLETRVMLPTNCALL